jgi:catalase-peroxidase
MRGGANGARVRLAPQKDWAANDPQELAKVIAALEQVQKDFGKQVSMADLIVLGGAAAIEKAASDAGHTIKVPFMGGRGDASQEMTEVESFAVLEPGADAFRNYYGNDAYASPTEMLVEKADLLTLTVPEMTALVGGMRALGANSGGSKHGVFTDKPGTLSNDFFVNLLDMSTQWEESKTGGIYNGLDRKTGQVKWTATPVDLIFGSQSELRAVAEVYASENDKFVKDFIAAWTKVMTLDRFDL